MAEMLDDQWHSRDLPVLREAVRQLDPSPSHAPSHEEMIEATGLSEDQVRAAGAALEQARLVELLHEGGGDFTFWAITPEARRLTGVWPTAEIAADRLIAAIEAAIERTDDPVQKSRLQKIREGFLAAGRDMTVSISAAVITGQIT
jgi:DNA-binding transcriptional ArsR family regulator